MRIASWNLNGVKARLETATRWLTAAQPDVVLLQETKSADDAFPSNVFEDLGYNVARHGQKGFNGVAILSKRPLEDVSFRLPGDENDDQARFAQAVVSMPWGALRVCGLYLPNGNPIGTDKFAYKMLWTDRLRAFAQNQLAIEEAFVLGGDFNTIPTPLDARFPQYWTGDALYQPEPRAAWRGMLNLGLTDALRAVHPQGGAYTFWDYQAGAWQKDNGIRIDHFLLSPQAADRLRGVSIDREPRGWDKPSDHVPIIADFDE